MITDSTHLFAFLAGILGLVFWLSTLKPLQKLFTYLPPVIWAYFVPMFATTFGIIPGQAEVYEWMRTHFLLIALFLIMLSVDVPAILKLGRLAFIMMIAGTIGIVLGGPIAYAVFKGALPPEAWKGFAALSGSWIGGSANMLAVQAHVGTPDSMMGPIIVVDTVVGYGWMGVLLFLSTFQNRFDKWVGADTNAIAETNAKFAALDQTRRPTDLGDFAILVGLGIVGAIGAILLADVLPVVRTPSGTTIIGTGTWRVLLVVTVGLALSFTKVQKLEEVGASKVGYAALYLLLTAIGAQADLKAVLTTPVFLVAGALWIAVHIVILFTTAKIFRAPLFFVATGSMANIGGAASAPVVAGVYHPALAPVGVLMAVAGYILGIYASFFLSTPLLEWVAGW